MKIDTKLDLERQNTKSASKDLADLETKLGGLKVSKLQIALFKANKKAAVTDLSLQKKIYKKELKVQTDLQRCKAGCWQAVVFENKSGISCHWLFWAFYVF
jgi:hypothetical protein